jgi:MFS family permease
VGTGTGTTAKDEWRRFWYLPLVAAFGYTAAGLQLYSIGPFVGPLQHDFGWSRAEIFVGITIANGGGAIFNLLIGWLVDRVGPRLVALIGVLLISGAIASLGTATGSTGNWALLWCLIAVGLLWVQPTVWSSAVASRFEGSRGLALGVTLSGVSLSAYILPLLATWLIDAYGWRSAFFGLGLIWAAALFPVLFLFFRGKQDVAAGARSKGGHAAQDFTGLTPREALRTSAFYKLLVAGTFFSFTIIGIVTNLVPLLTDGGTDRATAASIASLIGLFAIIGRLGTGFLLDRLPGPMVGAGAFLLPTFGSALLLWQGAGTLGHAAAAAIIGLSLGSELDALTFLSMRYFGLRSFGKLYGGLLVVVSIGTATGPLLAGAIFDRFGNYTQFLVLAMACMIASAIALLSLRGSREFRPEPMTAAAT